MIIDNPIVSGSLNVQNAVTASNISIASTASAAYFTGSFIGDGTQLSGVTSYTDSDTLDYINSLGVLSGSAQIASDISGSVTSLSSSLEQRITNQENFSSSLDATFATDAQVASAVSSLNAATSSYALQADISGAFADTSSSLAQRIDNISTDFDDITNKPTLISSSLQFNNLTTPFTGSFTGSFYGDGSNLSGVTSYTDADTLAFINSRAVLSGSIAELTSVTASFTNTGSVTIPHSFNSKNVSISVYDSNDILIIPQEVALISNSAVKLTFGGSTSGFAVVSKGGHIVSGSVPVPQISHVSDTFSSTTSHTVTHNFNTKDVIVSVYENDEVIIPDTVTTEDVNNVTVTFPEAISGRVVVVKAGHIVSGSIPFDNLLDSPFVQSATAVTASKSIVPSQDITYDLGSSTLRFRDLYLSSASIYLGNTVISEDNVVTTASLQSVLPSGTLSGSAQIASDISGSFTLVSASIASERLKNTTDTLDGDLTVTGKITAQEFHTEFVSASIIYQSGSTKFGDTVDDTHEFTGSVKIAGNIGVTNIVTNKVVKFNGSVLDDSIITDNGTNIGIGETNPTYKLDIRNSGNLFYGQTDLTDGTSVFRLRGDGGSSELLEVKADGKVGIGVSSPLSKLQVTGDGTYAGGITLRHGINQAHYLYTNSQYQYNRIGSSVGNWIWGQEGGSDYMTLNSTGLGIGSTPQTAIEGLRVVKTDSANIVRIKGATGTGGGASYYIEKPDSTNTFMAIGDEANIVGGTAATNAMVYTPSGIPLRFYIAGGEQMRIHSSGNVGIGAVSPAAKLDVVGDAIFSSYVGFNGVTSPEFPVDISAVDGGKILRSTRGTSIFRFDQSNDGPGYIGMQSNDDFSIQTNNTSKIYIKADGNVGIGTTDPSSYKLHVNSSTEDILNLHNTTDGLDSLISFTNPGGTLARIQGLDNGGLQIDTGNNAGGLNSNVVNLSNSGNVGINRTSPLYKLHVEGNAGFNDIILSNSSTSTFGTMSKVYQDYIKRSFVLNHSFTYTGSGTYYFNLAFPNSGEYGYDLRLVTGRSGNYRNFGYIKHSGQLYWESDGDFSHYTSGTFDVMSSADGGMTASVNSAYGANNINDNSQGTLNWSYYIVRYAITFPNGLTGNDGWFKVHLDTYGYGGDTAYFVKD